MGYYGLSENGTAMQAASGRLVDEILDIKARDILLQSKLDSQYADEVTLFNIGKMCLYHVDVNSQPGGQAGIITDIAIQNPISTTMTFPSTSTVVIGVDEIMPGAEMAAGANMTTNK